MKKVKVKRIFKDTLVSERKRRKKEEIEFERSLERTDEEWNIVSKFILNYILDKIKCYKDSWIEIPNNGMFIMDDDSRFLYDTSENIIQDIKNKKWLRLNHKDIERFCKENHLKLQFLVMNERGELLKQEKKYTFKVTDFRIKVKYLIT